MTSTAGGKKDTQNCTEPPWGETLKWGSVLTAVSSWKSAQFHKKGANYKRLKCKLFPHLAALWSVLTMQISACEQKGCVQTEWDPLRFGTRMCVLVGMHMCGYGKGIQIKPGIISFHSCHPYGRKRGSCLTSGQKAEQKVFWWPLPRI